MSSIVPRTIRAIVIVAISISYLRASDQSRAADEADKKSQPAAAPAISRIWLSHVSPDVRRITISFETERDGDTVVEYGPSEALGQTHRREEKLRLHQADVAVPVEVGPWFYRVRSGELSSPIIKARGYDDESLKVAVVGDLGYAKGKWQEAILREQPHVLMSAGDNVGEIHAKPAAEGKPRPKDNVENFRKLVDSSPELFRTIPFLPILGNHDREIRTRGPGPKPPEEPVYDVDATAYRKFFALPGDEWKWSFDFPRFGARFIALDLNHVQDHGTNWQTCHAYDKDSEQLAWYRAAMEKSGQPFVVTLNNEKLSVFRGLAGGEWWKTAKQGSALVTGFGYFAERAMADDVPGLNTSVGGKGAPYKDPKSAFFASENNYTLFTFEKQSDGTTNARSELKTLEGSPLDEFELRARAVASPKSGASVAPAAVNPLVIREGGTADKPAVYDFAGLTIDLGLDVTDQAWIKEGDVWRSSGKLFGRERIVAGQIAGLFIDEVPLSIPRDVATEKRFPEKKQYCYFAPADLKPGQMGYADDGSLYFRWPTGKDPTTARIIAPPAPGTSCVSIQCSHVVVKNLTVRHAANDGFNIHNKWVGIRLENVKAFSCADEGISAHGEVEMIVDGAEVAWNGSAAGGVADVDRSQTEYRNCYVHDNLGAAFYFSGKHHKVVDARIKNQARDFSAGPTVTFEQSGTKRE